jgi:thiol-disulfide isomerase/thioredoxin
VTLRKHPGVTRDRRMNLSGLERDRFFLSAGGASYLELSYLSGLDGIEDARASAVSDLDRDGHEDLVVVNRNAPLLRIYRNAVGPASRHHTLGLRLIGAGAKGTHAARASSRDAVGGRVQIRCGVRRLRRDVVMGAGFGGVSSLAITVGLGRCPRVDELSVRFPSGEEQIYRDVEADRFYTVSEGEGMREIPGLVRARPPRTVAGAPAFAAREVGSLLGSLGAAGRSGPRLLLISFWASWCRACDADHPRLQAIAEDYAGRLEVVSPSLEPKDDAEVARRVRTGARLGYRVEGYQEAIARAAEAIYGAPPALPATVIVDRASRRVELRTTGTPSRSEIEKVLWRARGYSQTYPDPSSSHGD